MDVKIDHTSQLRLVDVTVTIRVNVRTFPYVWVSGLSKLYFDQWL